MRRKSQTKASSGNLPLYFAKQGYQRVPKIAEPTRTLVAPKPMAVS